MSAPTDQERFTFQAEVAQLLDLMIHSLYSNKEIFLRELVSNASDAIDRLRFAVLTEDAIDEPEEALEIHVRHDEAARTITITDNGIGMSRAEVMDNIGTIAKSGTREFLGALTGDQRKDAALIGQFGVGFYSAFIVADRVTLTTRRAGLPAGEGVRWESDGRGEYSLETVEREERGTELVLHLREDEGDLLNGHRLRTIIKKYSDHISLPILMPDDAVGDEAPAETVVNRASALWTRPKSEITEEEYSEFYKHVAHDFTDPLAHLHAKMEGTYEYTLLLFVPATAPYDLWMPEARRGVKLHVRRVFIMDDTGQLMPNYLRFIRGVIDSSDLPLNVSREILQSSRVVDSMRSSAVKRVLKLLKEMAEKEPEKYATFWGQYGPVLKEGVVEDYSNREDIARLLRFTSTRSATNEPDVSLDGYVERMKEGQDKIYYVLAPTPAAAKSSPHLEIFRNKGIEVLLLGDTVDNWLVGSLPDFEGKRLQSVTQGVTDLGDLEDEAEKTANEKAGAELADLVARLKTALGDKVFDVRTTNRLTTSPACIVANEPEPEISLARVSGTGMPSRPVLEINPGHAIIRGLADEKDDERLSSWAHILHGQSVLTLGARIEDPAAFVTGLNDLLISLSGPDGDDSATTE